jgi:DNA-binding phage protein
MPECQSQPLKDHYLTKAREIIRAAKSRTKLAADLNISRRTLGRILEEPDPKVIAKTLFAIIDYGSRQRASQGETSQEVTTDG